MRQIRARIAENRSTAQGFYKMRIESKYIAQNIRPGKFVEVRCREAVDPLLRRPFSCHRILADGIEILYEVVGKATEALSNRKRGEIIDVIGPLGNGFDIERTTHGAGRTTILVAGGMGVAPLVALAEEIAYSVERIADRKRIIVLIGARIKTHVTCEKEFKKLGCRVMITTDDGSRGKKGPVTDLLKNLLSAIRYPLSAKIYACGPHPMLKTVAHLASSHGVSCQVSLEERMACGVGVCLGCPVKLKDGYKLVCKDGPVFDAEEVVW